MAAAACFPSATLRTTNAFPRTASPAANIRNGLCKFASWPQRPVAPPEVPPCLLACRGAAGEQHGVERGPQTGETGIRSDAGPVLTFDSQSDDRGDFRPQNRAG